MASEEYDAMVAERDQLKAELLQAAKMIGNQGRTILQLNKEVERLKSEINESEWDAIVTKLENENEALRAQLAQQQVVPEWVPVSERLPDIAQEVIVHTEFDGVCAGVLDSYGEWFAPCSEYKLTRVTHWMPLPPAPEIARLNSKKEGGSHE